MQGAWSRSCTTRWHKFFIVISLFVLGAIILATRQESLAHNTTVEQVFSRDSRVRRICHWIMCLQLWDNPADLLHHACIGPSYHDITLCSISCLIFCSPFLYCWGRIPHPECRTASSSEAASHTELLTIISQCVASWLAISTIFQSLSIDNPMRSEPIWIRPELR